MALGKSNKEIGQVFYISENTVKNHMKAILKKLDAIGRTEAIAIGLFSTRAGGYRIAVTTKEKPSSVWQPKGGQSKFQFVDDGSCPVNRRNARMLWNIRIVTCRPWRDRRG